MNIINLKENKIKLIIKFSEIDFFLENHLSILGDNCKSLKNSFFLIENLLWLEDSFVFIISKHSYYNFPFLNKNSSHFFTYIFALSNLMQFANFIKLIRAKKNNLLKSLSKCISLYLYNNNYFLILQISKKESIYYQRFISILFEMFSFISSSKSLENIIKKEGKLLFKNNTVIFPSKNNKKGE